MQIDRVWAMPNKHTFTIKPIRHLLTQVMCDKEVWVDPFAGYNSPAQVTNDLDGYAPTKFHQDALVFLRALTSDAYDGVLFDPPYSFYELRRCYKSIGIDHYKWGELNDYWARCKDEVARIIKPHGKCLSFGWNSVGIGKNRHFEKSRILLICHGSVRNDTIATLEFKYGEDYIGARW